jgi:hypothetical protein
LGRPDRFLVEDLGIELGELALDPLDRLLGLLALPDEEAQEELVVASRLVVQREARRVGPAMLAAVEHGDQGAADVTVGPVLLVEHPGDTAHIETSASDV